MSASEHSCQVEPFVRTIKAGQSATFTARPNPGPPSRTYEFIMGNLPHGVAGAIRKSPARAATQFTFSTTGDADIGSFEIVVVYDEIIGETRNRTHCLVNLVIEHKAKTETPGKPEVPGEAGRGAGPLDEGRRGGAPVSGRSSPALPPQPVVSVSQRVSARFTQSLNFGSTHEDVRRLQVILAQDPALYPEGLVTGFYGVFTTKAVKRFQTRVGIAATGELDDLTRAKFEATFEGKVPPIVFTETLRRGAEGESVEKLQRLLQQLGFFPAAEVPTGYFGPITETAVRSFQAAKGIEAVGIVGPFTRAALSHASAE